MSQHKSAHQGTSHSGKNSNTARRRKTERLWLVGGIAVIGVVLLLVIGTNLNRPQTGALIQVTGAPRITVEQDTFDYGDIKMGTLVEPTFRVRNVGDKPLVILNRPQVRVIEGCCPPPVDLSTQVIAPGQEATIKLSFTMTPGMGGKHRFHIDLQTNDPQEPNKQLVVLSNWI